MLLKHFYPYLNEAGDPGASGGAGTGVDTPPPPPPTTGEDPTQPKFTDKDMAAMRRKHERELKIRDKQIEEQNTRLADLENRINNPEPAPTPGVDPHSAGELEIMQKRYERELEQLRNQNEETRRMAEDERTKRRNVERDRALTEALTLAGVSSDAKIYAKDHFEKKIVWDDVDACWVYKTKNGNLVDIADGVMEEMPDMFKRPAATRGGAGTQAGMPPTRARLSAQLEAARAKLNEIKAKGGKNQANVMAFTKQLRIVKQLEAQVNQT